jgi:periplasmic protein TonB
MNSQPRAFVISLLLHGTVIGLFFVMDIMAAVISKPVIIDFTLVEPNAPPSPAPAAKMPAPKEPQKKVATKAEPIRQQPVAALKPAFEPQGPAAVVSDKRDLAPPTTSQIAKPVSQAATGPVGNSSNDTAGPSPEQLKTKYRSEHFEYIRKIIRENLEYPQRAKRMGQTGKVVVAITILKNGHVKDIRIVKSTGFEVLDESVKEAVIKVEPFPPPPISVTLNIPFNFNLE